MTVVAVGHHSGNGLLSGGSGCGNSNDMVDVMA